MLVKACLQTLTILKRRQPNVVLGMGGFVAGPGGLMAWLLRIPLVIHEQNRVPGTTNRILAKFANRVLEAFPGSFAENINATWTGNPLRKDISSLGAAAHSAGNRIKVLVVGGSLGAQVLNEIVPEAAALIDKLEIKHQTGKDLFDQVKTGYENFGVKAEVLSFIDNMSKVYQWADLIICRAGAMTVSEIAAAGLPSILIPYPYAIDDHQTANARFLSDAGAGVMVSQEQFNTQQLAELLRGFQNNPEALVRMSRAATACAKLDATDTVAEICEQEANK